jgi:hypothetical protein
VLHPKLPIEDYSLVIRTDFSDDAAWESVCKAIQTPQGDGSEAMVQCISDEACSGLSPEAVWSLLPDDFEGLFVFIVDAQALSSPENPVLVADFGEEPGFTFRVIPSAAWAVENNLRLANMGFDDFEALLGADRILRSALG